MSRNVPATIKPHFNAGETQEAFIVLLDITHDNGIIKLCNDSVNYGSSLLDQWSTVTGGHWNTATVGNWHLSASEISTDTYVAFPFTLTLPNEVEGQIARCNIQMDNVSRRLVDEIREQENRLRVDITVIEASSGDIIAMFPEFKARDVRYSATSLTMSLTLEELLHETFPGMLFSKKNFRGLFP